MSEGETAMTGWRDGRAQDSGSGGGRGGGRATYCERGSFNYRRRLVRPVAAVNRVVGRAASTQQSGSIEELLVEHRYDAAIVANCRVHRLSGLIGRYSARFNYGKGDLQYKRPERMVLAGGSEPCVRGDRGDFGSPAGMECVISAALPDRLTLPLSLLILICMWKLPRAARGAIIALFLTRTVASAPLRLFVYYLLRVCRRVAVYVTCACVCVWVGVLARRGCLATNGHCPSCPT